MPIFVISQCAAMHRPDIITHDRRKEIASPLSKIIRIKSKGINTTKNETNQACFFEHRKKSKLIF